MMFYQLFDAMVVLEDPCRILDVRGLMARRELPFADRYGANITQPGAGEAYECFIGR